MILYCREPISLDEFSVYAANISGNINVILSLVSFCKKASGKTGYSCDARRNNIYLAVEKGYEDNMFLLKLSSDIKYTKLSMIKSDMLFDIYETREVDE